MNTAPSPLLFAVPGVMMLLALSDMPYGYYQVLRIVACLASVVLSAAAWKAGREGWAAAFALLAITFNPIIRLALEREQWAIVNLVAALCFFVGYSASRRWATATVN